MTNVYLERAHLSDGIPAMCQDYGDRVYAAYDPNQGSEAEAIAWLYARVPRLVTDGYQLLHTTS